MHATAGEDCYPPGTEAWEEYGFKEGYCVLCLYIQWQKMLDAVYESDPNTTGTRFADPKAVLFPKMDKSGAIHWHEFYDMKMATHATRELVAIADTRRPATKRSELFTSHSNKVGGGQEAFKRMWSMHETQMLTGHTDPRVLLMYARLMGQFAAGRLLSEIQHAPLEQTHGISSSRDLYKHLLNGLQMLDTVVQQQEETQRLLHLSQEREARSEAREARSEAREAQLVATCRELMAFANNVMRHSAQSMHVILGLLGPNILTVSLCTLP
jgi:hypothetical protein